MAITDQLATAGPYVNRLFDDDYVREQIGDALVRGRRAYRRARAEKAAEAVQDKRLMDHVTGAARSLQEAIRALAGQPPPKPRRRGLRPPRCSAPPSPPAPPRPTSIAVTGTPARAARGWSR